jgi:MinD-like ATPase involved in chromosome partitioning or flagellar assembly
VGDSINRGTPFVTASPESDISRSIRELAGALVPGGAVPAAAGVGAGKGDSGKKRRIFGR